MKKDLLSPLQLVELGNRITKERGEKLGLVGLIEDARLVVQEVLRSVAGACAPLGVSRPEVEHMLLGTSWYAIQSWADKNPRREPHSYAQIPMGDPGTVLSGKKQRAGSTIRFAFVVRDGAALLLGEDRERWHRAYGSLSGLAHAAGYRGPPKNFWKREGQYRKGARLR